MKEVTIELHFISNETKVMQAGSFPLRRKNPVEVAFDFWKQIQRKMPFGGELEKVLIDGEFKTDQVKELERSNQNESTNRLRF